MTERRPTRPSSRNRYVRQPWARSVGVTSLAAEHLPWQCIRSQRRVPCALSYHAAVVLETGRYATPDGGS